MQEDFEQFLWTVVFLAMGGIALGKGVTSSGLLDVMDDGIRDMISGLSLYTVVMVISLIVLVCAICLVLPFRDAHASGLGCLYLYQPYDRQCAAGSHR